MLVTKFQRTIGADKIQRLEEIRQVRRYFTLGAQLVLELLSRASGRPHFVRQVKDLEDDLADLESYPQKENAVELLAGEFYWVKIRQEEAARLAQFLGVNDLEGNAIAYPWQTVKPEVRYGWDDITAVVEQVVRPEVVQ